MPGLVATSGAQGPAPLPARSTRNPSSLIALSVHVIRTVQGLSKTATTLDAASGSSGSGAARTGDEAGGAFLAGDAQRRPLIGGRLERMVPVTAAEQREEHQRTVYVEARQRHKDLPDQSLSRPAPCAKPSRSSPSSPTCTDMPWCDRVSASCLRRRVSVASLSSST